MTKNTDSQILLQESPTMRHYQDKNGRCYEGGLIRGERNNFIHASTTITTQRSNVDIQEHPFHVIQEYLSDYPIAYYYMYHIDQVFYQAIVKWVDKNDEIISVYLTLKLDDSSKFQIINQYGKNSYNQNSWVDT